MFLFCGMQPQRIQSPDILKQSQEPRNPVWEMRTSMLDLFNPRKKEDTIELNVEQNVKSKIVNHLKPLIPKQIKVDARTLEPFQVMYKLKRQKSLSEGEQCKNYYLVLEKQAGKSKMQIMGIVILGHDFYGTQHIINDQTLFKKSIDFVHNVEKARDELLVDSAIHVKERNQKNANIFAE